MASRAGCPCIHGNVMTRRPANVCVRVCLCVGKSTFDSPTSIHFATTLRHEKGESSRGAPKAVPSRASLLARHSTVKCLSIVNRTFNARSRLYTPLPPNMAQHGVDGLRDRRAGNWVC